MQGAHASTQIKKNEAEIFLSLNGMSGEEDEKKKSIDVIFSIVMSFAKLTLRAEQEKKRNE